MNIATPRHPATASRPGRWAELKSAWMRRIINLGVAIVVGWLLGSMIYRPNPRIIKGLVGFAVLYAGWRFPIPVSLSAFLLLFPFPFGIAYGSSNTIFVFLITAMWLAQIVLKTSHPVGKTLLDIPIVFLLGAYLLSFNNVSNSTSLGMGLLNLSTIIAGIFAYYLIVHSVRDEKTLRHMVRIVTIMVLLCFAVAIYELVFPGQPMIRGWILPATYYDPTKIQISRGLRVGGPFQDFELFAEFCALVFPLMLFQALRSNGSRSRVLWGGIVLLNFFILMATVTRGATLSLILGMIYLLYRLRKQLTPKQFVFIICLAITVSAAFEFYLATYTVSGSVFDRIVNTKFVDGLPDSRSFWPQILARCFEHPWIGHGPFYEFGEFGKEKLRRFMWPHNGYLYYFHTVGLLGLGAFLVIMGRMWWATSQQCLNSLTDDYARSLLLVWNTMLTIFAIDQAKIEYLRNLSYQFWPWIIFGLTVATLNVVRNQELGLGDRPNKPKTVSG